MLRHQPTPPAERFDHFQAHHGPLESPLSNRLLAVFFEKAITQYFDHGPSSTLQAHVSGFMQHKAPDILAVLELSADWSKDPLAAAHRLLRDELDAKTKADDATRKAREEAELRAAIKAKAEAFLQDQLIMAPAGPASCAPGAPKCTMEPHPVQDLAPGAPAPSQPAPKTFKAPDPAAVAASRK